MPAEHPSTEVYAFSEPKIKGAELRVAINLGAGVLHVLHATRCVWRNLYDHLAREFGPAPAQPVPPPLPRARRPRAPRLSPEVQKLYTEAYIRKVATGCTYRAAADAFGIPVNAWNTWCHKHRAELEQAVAAGRQPIAKPSGRLL